MPHGSTRFDSFGFCIYCRNSTRALSAEHIVPYSLGGQHVIRAASCCDCANVTKKFEQDVARELWGDARISYNAPSRRKKKRPAFVTVQASRPGVAPIKVPYAEYPSPMVFYKMPKAGILQGFPQNLDISEFWLICGISSEERLKQFSKKFPNHVSGKFRHVPESFGRLLAKIGYCHVLSVIDPSLFREICVPYILGKKQNVSHIVGSNFDTSVPWPKLGYRLSIFAVGHRQLLILGAEIHLFSNEHTPVYHVIIGYAAGDEMVEAIIGRLQDRRSGEIVKVDPENYLPTRDDHWMPDVWPIRYLPKSAQASQSIHATPISPCTT